MIARNDDSGSGHFTAKKFVVVQPEEHPAVYKSVLSHVEIPLPEGALRFTAMPNAVEGKGIWAASGVNAANVGMTATETITSNPRVLGADPLVEYQPAKGEKPEVPGGIGEEDIVYLADQFCRNFDKKYGKESPALAASRKLQLFACRLKFKHPRTGKIMDFQTDRLNSLKNVSL